MIKYRGINPNGGFEEKEINNFPIDWIVEEIIIEENDFSIICENEINELREFTRREISSLIYEHTQRKLMRGIEIPEEVQIRYEEMRAEYQDRKNQILIKYNQQK